MRIAHAARGLQSHRLVGIRWRDRRGTTSVEAVLVLASIAVVALGAWAALGRAVERDVDCITGAVGGARGPCEPAARGPSEHGRGLAALRIGEQLAASAREPSGSQLRAGAATSGARTAALAGTSVARVDAGARASRSRARAGWAGLRGESLFGEVRGAKVRIAPSRRAVAARIVEDARALLDDPRIYLDDRNGPGLPGGEEAGTFRRLTDLDGDGRIDAVGQRYLWTEGNEAIARASALGFAFNQERDRRYLDALARLGQSLVALEDWNARPDHRTVIAQDGSTRALFEFDSARRDGRYQPNDRGLAGHGLDPAHLATAAAMVLSWTGGSAPLAQRRRLAKAIVSRFLVPYLCHGESAVCRDVTAPARCNKDTVIHTAALMAALAVTPYDAKHGARAASKAYEALAHDLDALSNGPTEESLLYTAYELQYVGYLRATERAAGTSRALRERLRKIMPRLGALSRYYSLCGVVREPGFNDGAIEYAWLSRGMGLAAVRSWRATPEIEALYAELQGEAAPHGYGAYERDGLAELLYAERPDARAERSPAGAAVFGAGRRGARQASGCVTHGAGGGVRAWMEGSRNDAPHAHRDSLAVVVDIAGDRLLYNAPGDSTNSTVRATRLHNTVGWVEEGLTAEQSVAHGRVRAYRRRSRRPPSIVARSEALTTSSGGGIRRTKWSRALSSDTRSGRVRVVVRDEIESARPGSHVLRWTWYVPRTIAIHQRNANTFELTTGEHFYTAVTDGRASIAEDVIGGVPVWRISVDERVHRAERVTGGITVTRW